MGFSNPAMGAASEANPNPPFSISRYVGSKNPVAGDMLRKILGEDQSFGAAKQPQIEVNPQAIVQSRTPLPKFGGLETNYGGLLPLLDFYRGRP